MRVSHRREEISEMEILFHREFGNLLAVERRELNRYLLDLGIDIFCLNVQRLSVRDLIEEILLHRFLKERFHAYVKNATVKKIVVSHKN